MTPASCIGSFSDLLQRPLNFEVFDLELTIPLAIVLNTTNNILQNLYIMIN